MKGLLKANICFLKIARLSEFLILESKLFHSVIVEGKKEFLKYSCLTLERGMLFLCHVIHASLAVGINSKRYLGDWFLIILKKRQSFLYSYSACYCKCCIVSNRFELFMKKIYKHLVI